jgi:hypothetical protein
MNFLLAELEYQRRRLLPQPKLASGHEIWLRNFAKYKIGRNLFAISRYFAVKISRKSAVNNMYLYFVQNINSTIDGWSRNFAQIKFRKTEFSCFIFVFRDITVHDHKGLGCNVALIKCTLDSGKPKGGWDFGREGTGGPDGEQGELVYKQPGTEVDDSCHS